MSAATAERRMCKPCGRKFAVKKDGDLYAHQCKRLVKCAGCGKDIQYCHSWRTLGAIWCNLCVRVKS